MLEECDLIYGPQRHGDQISILDCGLLSSVRPRTMGRSVPFLEYLFQCLHHAGLPLRVANAIHVPMHWMVAPSHFTLGGLDDLMPVTLRDSANEVGIMQRAQARVARRVAAQPRGGEHSQRECEVLAEIEEVLVAALTDPAWSEPLGRHEPPGTAVSCALR